MRKTALAGAALAAALVTTVSGATAQARPCEECGGGGENGTGSGPAVYLKNGAARHVVLRLKAVQANDTEDVTGGDELYLVGGLRIGQHEQPTQLAPTSIDDGESIALGASIAADGVRGNDRLSIITNATDQDFARDWAQYGPSVTGVGGAIYGASMAFPPTAPFTIAAAPAVGAAYAIFNAISLSDKDDVLVDQRVDDFRVGDFPVSTSTRTFRVANSAVPWWSDWDYTFTYEVEVSS
jgi:hypothetical protein